MSAAYLGTVGGLVIISCDDPGPHSSQTEQDTRLMARLAKVPVLDPSNPEEARKMVGLALDLSEEFRVPVILRLPFGSAMPARTLPTTLLRPTLKKVPLRKTLAVGCHSPVSPHSSRGTQQEAQGDR